MMCEQNGRFLFEALPQHFPHGRWTEDEAALWALHYQSKEKKQT